jgi:dienelactone hydrolase
MAHRLILALVVSLALAGCGSAAPTAPPAALPSPAPTGSVGASSSPAASADAASVARGFVEALSRGDDAAAQALEDTAMLAAVPAPKLSQLWGQFVAQYGAFGAIGDIATTTQPPYTVVTVQTAFARATLPLLVTVTGAGQVGGLHVGAPQPAASPGATSSPAAYVDLGSFTDTDVTVGSAPWALPGTLSMPNGSGPFPAVVLVAGSGPEDRDATIGPNKPLRDIAWGLASAGIAVLRYDKRTLVYGVAMTAQQSSLTVRQETTDDAVAAIALVRTTTKVDPNRVFLAGHSLGAYLAPRIAVQAPGQVRGVVLLEANSTPLPELILAQTEYLASLQVAPNPSAGQQLAALRAAVALAESPDLSPATPASQLPLGIPASYWLDLRAYDPLATAAGLAIPMFFSQGGRDYQVPPSELQGWEKALAGHSNVTFKTYAAMDHLLLDGSGPATPAEYSVPGHVDSQLVADLAAWLKRQ